MPEHIFAPARTRVDDGSNWNFVREPTLEEEPHMADILHKVE
jgi:hypothetical protein